MCAGAAQAAPTLSILAPTEGATIDSGTVLISVNITNLTLNGSAIGQSSVAGEGHFHIYLDNVWLRAEVQTDTYLAGVASGPHVLRIELSQNNHTELGVGAQVNITVQPGAPRVVILAPGNSTSWGSNSAELTVRVDNFTLDAAAWGGAPVAGRGHYRVLVSLVVRGEGATTFYNITHLALNATNVVRVELVGNDGAPLATPAYDQVTLRPSAGAPALLLDGAMVGALVNASSLRAAFTLSSFTLDAAAFFQPPVAGRGHYLAWFDGVSIGPGVANPILLSNMPAGNHTLLVELVNNDNTPLAVRVVDFAQFRVLLGGPGVAITSPNDGATVNASSVELSLLISNFTLSVGHLGGANVAGEGHWHVFVDGVDVNMGGEDTALVSDLSQGPHVLLVELRNNDHSPFPWPPFDTLRIVVPSGAPRLLITSPAGPSATVASSSVELTIQVQNFTMNAASIGLAPVPGQGHWHLFVDGVYRGLGTSLSVLASRLEPGTHVVVVELYNNDHTDLLWPAFDQVTITVPQGSPTLAILSPTPATSLPLNFTGLRVAVTNFTVVEKPDQAPVAGEGHWHIFLDGAFYDMAYGATAVVQNLGPGTHTIRAVLVGNNHAFVDPLVADEVAVTVGGARASISITSPADGFVLYGDRAEITVVLENFTLAPAKVGQAAVAGEGHWHYLLDGAYLTYVTALTFSATGLAPGNHTLTARLYNNDHSPLDIRIESVVLIHVSGAPAITITAPTNGLVTTETSLSVTVSITNFTLDPVAGNNTIAVGRGHWHVYVDGVLSTMEDDLNATVAGLAVGPHEVRVELVNRDHTALGVAGSSAKIIVTIQEAAAPPVDTFPTLLVLAVVAAVGAGAGVTLFLMRRKPKP